MSRRTGDKIRRSKAEGGAYIGGQTRPGRQLCTTTAVETSTDRKSNRSLILRCNAWGKGRGGNRLTVKKLQYRGRGSNFEQLELPHLDEQSPKWSICIGRGEAA